MESRAKKIVITVSVVIVALLLVLVVVRVLNSKLFAEKEPEVAKKEPVTVVEVVRGEIRDTLFYTGDISAEKQVDVYPVVSGNIIRYNYREGERIKKGAPLAMLERLETWDEFKPVVVESPITGIVAYNYLDVGELATPQTPISIIAGGDGIKVTIKVPDVELGLIKKGMGAEVRVPTAPDRVFIGSVTKVSPIINSSTRTAYVEIMLEEKDKELWPGMYGDVTLIIEQKEDVLIIPTDAIMFKGEGNSEPYCFAINDDKAQERLLTLGIIEKGRIEVISGLEGGEFVADLGKENLKDGSNVVVGSQ